MPARPVRRAAQASIVVAFVAVGIGLIAPGLSLQLQLPGLAVGFLLGLPHGAVDHLVPFWTGWTRLSVVTMCAVLFGYMAVAGLTWAGLHWAGRVVLPALLVVSVLHFGAGDVMADRDDRPSGLGWPSSGPSWPSRLMVVIAVVARGGPVVAGPLLFWPGLAERALSSVQLSSFVVPAFSTRVVLAATVGVCVLVSAGRAVRRGRRGAALEVLLLAGLFTVVPPLAAFGIYFGAWHGLRHTARLIARDPRNRCDLAAGKMAKPVRRFLVSAAVPTVVAAGTALLTVAVADRHTDLTGTLFTVLLALTAPHLIMVAALDLTDLHRHTGGPAPAVPPLPAVLHL